MKDDNIRYVLVRTQTDAAEWLFRESEEASAATWRFDQILESWRGDRRLTSKLRTFLNRCPWHIDAITHYSGCKLNEGKLLDAFAFAQLAVCIARTAFPSEFEEGRHRIPGGFVENRPFLRSLYNLMNAQAWIDEQAAAAATAYQILSYDREDRMGARMELPKYLLQCGLHREAVTLFEDEAFEGNFASAMYLYPVALLGCGREEKAIEAIRDCLIKPRIAKYILNPDLPQPEPEQTFLGITVGSELEGYVYAEQYRPFWEADSKALAMLNEQYRDREHPR